MKVGSKDWRGDIDRVTYVVESVKGIEVMVDANQAWDADTAIEAGQALQEVGVYWLEEPVDVNDVDGCARVAASLGLRIASGESIFTRHGFKPLIERRAVDVLMPDVMRCGGPTEFMQIAAMADARVLPVSSHLFTEISAHLIAASPAGTLVEYIPGWFDDLFEGVPTIKDGSMTLSETPGLGFAFSHKAIHNHSVDEVVVIRKEN
jgi:mandelate racemase